MIVVKIGGSVVDPEHVLRDIATLEELVVVVHGASRELDALSTRLGCPPRIVESGRGDTTRYTDDATMDCFLMAYAGKVNKRIVERLLQLGVKAVGLTGLDGLTVRARRRAELRIQENGRPKVLHGNRVGTIQSVNTTLLRLLLASGYTPVVTPPAAGEDGTALNVDGDRLAAELAVALQAEWLVILSDTCGLMRDVSDPASAMPTLARDDVTDVLQRAEGRIRTKVQAASLARERGVSVVLADGTVVGPISSAIAGAGTVLAAV